MTVPNRDVTTAPQGAIGATSNKVLRRLGITRLGSLGVKGVRGGRRRRGR